MPTHTAVPPPSPATQPDGDARPASATEPAWEMPPDPASRPREISAVEIAMEAYARYEQRGREDGHDVEDWLAAEESLRRARARQFREREP